MIKINPKQQEKYNMLKNKKDIESWLKSMEIKNYTINDDLTVDVNEGVNISLRGLTHLPVQFGIVKGHFYIDQNELTSCEGFPKFVDGSLLCYSNEITSLKHCTTEVNGIFDCSQNKLSSLEYCPKTINGDFNCSYNQLTSLKHSPKTVNGNYYCQANKLTSLKGISNDTNGIFNCSHNKLTSLNYAPNSVEYFLCHNNQLTSLKGLKTKIRGSFDCSHNQITSLEGMQKNINGNLFVHNNIPFNYQNLPDYIKDDFLHDGNQELGIKKNQPLNEVKAIVLYNKLNENLHNKNKPKTTRKI